MYFRKLPEHVKQGIIFLNQDEVFRERFRHDPVLDELDEEDLDLDRCKSHLEQVFSGFIAINGKRYKPMTLGAWSYLWACNSPFVRNSKDVTVEDLDKFFFYTQEGPDATGDYDGYFLKMEIPPTEMAEVVTTLIKDAFDPLSVMPNPARKTTGKVEVEYDLQWMVSIVSSVHRLTGASQKEIMLSMPMMVCMSYYVQDMKEKGAKGIGRRSSAEIVQAKDKRSCELIVDRLEELHIIKEEEKEHFIQMMLDVNISEK